MVSHSPQLAIAKLREKYEAKYLAMDSRQKHYFQELANMILFLTEKEILDIEAIITIIESNSEHLWRFFNFNITENEHYKNLFTQCQENGITDPQAMMEFVLAYENRYKTPEEIKREAEENIREAEAYKIYKEKLQSLNEKQVALNTLYEESFKIYKEITKWHDEDRQTRKQETLDELNTLLQEIKQQEDDLRKVTREEREALFPSTPKGLSAEVVTETTGEAEQEPSITELTGDTVDNGPAEDFA